MRALFNRLLGLLGVFAAQHQKDFLLDTLKA